jgi:type II secretory pathway predicted ATPase ExeA
VAYAHFGLSRRPFLAAVDPDSYWPSPTHDAALAAIASAFARRDPLVLVDGDSGVGKSLVARKWLDQLPTEVPRVVVINARAESPAELLQAILFDLGLPYQGLTEQELRLAATARLLDSAAESGHPTVILLDEAHLLSHAAIEELRLLGNLECRNGPAVFAVLAAHLEFRDRLSRAKYRTFAQRLNAKSTIDSFDIDQSRDYVRHQLNSAGGDSSTIFEDEAIEVIAGACRGVPRILNRAASRAMELALAGQASTVDIEAAMGALEELEIRAEAAEAAPVELRILPHPSRSAESTKSTGKKTPGLSGDNEVEGPRVPKQKSVRKRAA